MEKNDLKLKFYMTLTNSSCRSGNVPRNEGIGPERAFEDKSLQLIEEIKTEWDLSN